MDVHFFISRQNNSMGIGFACGRQFYTSRPRPMNLAKGYLANLDSVGVGSRKCGLSE